ncbi:DUF6241 domain-containing protein [uncultured Clostridium sp.]|uniref:DUF6241 domain-containing protein n=1 Tax=uncultured Clostridium sp. TaxID=59620 RepID=UPI0025D84CC3|nr:DUF6241 domain-containing protein [uncultured Clostridium sp.]MDU4884001.1 DUF6241 domain-containing protein [Clostridium celatum]MDU7077244.1 DUF6241 domain-containing protein [Clostridium celatum]
MGKSVKERLDETIKRDKREINEEDNNMKPKENKETNVEDFMNKKIKEMIGDDEQKLKEDNESDDFEEDFQEEFEEKSSNVKKVIVILLVLIISLSTILVLWSNGYEIVNFAFDKVSEINEEKNSEKKNEVVESEGVAQATMDLTQCYQTVHHMANTIIIADDGQIWGQNEITREAVTQMVNELKGRDDYLSDELKKWLELDFSNGVEVHNYVWDKLDGNIGKAKDLNQEKIQQVIKSMTE